MKKMITWLNDSSYIPPISPGCLQCAEGSKLVLLATGKCESSCFYCPLSNRKSGNDVIYADEWELINENDVTSLISEAKAINAEGAGITGGDPLLVWKRTQNYIKILKQTFGASFHIHLYTSGLTNRDHISDLIKSGLNEIRFHPPPNHWDSMDTSPIKKAITTAKKMQVDVALEIPVIPDKKEAIIKLINWAEQQKLVWINLNELEFSETNAEALLNNGFHTKGDISSAVESSQEIAYEIINAVKQMDFMIGVHYCSVSFKDGIQLRNRIKRRAKNIARPFDTITNDGTIVFGIIQSDSQSLDEIAHFLEKENLFQKKDFFINSKKQRIEIAGWILEEIAPRVTKNKWFCYLVEEYPTADHLEVERISL